MIAHGSDREVMYLARKPRDVCIRPLPESVIGHPCEGVASLQAPNIGKQDVLADDHVADNELRSVIPPIREELARVTGAVNPVSQWLTVTRLT